jgi:Skp family chaperone for outer membrane proteins
MTVMKKVMTGVVAGVVALAALQVGPATVRGQSGGGGGSSPQMVLAVVNLAKVFDGLDEKRENAAQLDKMTKDLSDEQVKRKDELDKMSKNISDVLKPGTQAYEQAQDDLLRKAMEYQTQQQFAQQKVSMEERSRYTRLYLAVNKAIEDYAKSAGIVMVFVADDPDFSGARTREDVLNRITLRKVVYADPRFDITNAIVAKMNTEYRHPAGR